MAVAFVQKAGNVKSDFDFTTITVTLTGTAGNVLVGFVYWDGVANTLVSVADTVNTYTLYQNPTSSTAGRGALFVAVLGTTGSITITATLSTTTLRSLVVHEVSGVDTTTPVRGTNAAGQNNPGPGANILSSGAVSVTSGDYLFAATSCVGHADATLTAGTTIAWTIRHTENDLASEERIATATESRAATFGETGDNQYVTGMVALAPASTVSTTIEWQPPAVQLTNHFVTSIVNMRATTPMPVPYLRTTPTRTTNPLDWVSVSSDVIWTDG